MTVWTVDASERLRRAEADVPAFLERLETLVRHESPSGDAAANERVASALSAMLGERGADVETREAPDFGRHLLARLPGNGDGGAPLLVLGHMDTVHPLGTLSRNPWSVSEGRVSGPGAYDMKAGLAIVLGALDLLAALDAPPRGPVTVLVTCDEEVGSPTSRPLIEAEARGARATLVLEPPAPGGAAKVQRKGVAGYRLGVHGRPAHAGIEPEAGASAVHELARQIVRVLALADAAAGTTVNVGVVEGGTRSNVIAERAEAVIDVRFWVREEAERVEAALGALQPEDSRCTLDLSGSVNRWALERNEASERLLAAAQEEAAELGFELGAGRTGGASDGNFTSGVGCPTLDGLGPDGGGAHTLDEHVLLDDVPRRIAMIAGLLRRL